MPVREMIGSPMAKPKPRAIIMVVKKSELAAYKCSFLTILGMDDDSAGAKNWEPTEIKKASEKAAVDEAFTYGVATRHTPRALTRLETTITALLLQRST